ncbi:MAG: 50S ribosomal protein L24 [Deltaproteobacteria bacterium]|nr:50S ribosomal protein L24 [Deltaproteobacteria bacterium]
MSNLKYRIKRDDMVVVLAGKDKGKTGKVLRVLPEDGRVVVEGANLVKRHQKPSGDQRGSIVYKEASLHVSNVAYFDATAGRAVKVGYRTLEDGRKVRINRATGAVLDNA